jgi:hypothetical protein
MAIEDLINRFILSDEAILERVDEYALYCKYLGFQPQLRTKYKSRIRTGNSDDSPSFSIFTSNKPNREYFWKDSGGRGQAGDIFKLIMLLHGYTEFRHALQKIDLDFNLNFGSPVPPQAKIITYLPPEDVPADISIKSRPFTKYDLDYWNQFGVTQPLLTKFKTHSVALYWLSKDQQGGSTPVHGPAFAYQILKRYQIYQPYAPADRKFRQNLTDRDLHGFHQLAYEKDNLIITKSRKDVITLTAHGFEAVAPRSENTPIAPEYLRYLETKYKKIYTMFDNDGKHRRDFYPLEYTHTEIPLSTDCKDPAEHRAKYGETEFIKLITNLL